MAEEDKDQAEGTAEAAPAKSSGNKKILMIVSGIVGLLLVIGIPVTLFVLKNKNQTDELSADAANGGDIVAEGHDDEDELDEGEAALGAIFPLETFVVNLQGGRFIRCQVQLEFETRDIPKRFYTRMVPIRDSIITLLTKREANDITTEKGKTTLKSEIRELVNEILHKEDIKNVYFTQFVVQ